MLAATEDRASTLCRFSVDRRTTSDLPHRRGIQRQTNNQISTTEAIPSRDLLRDSQQAIFEMGGCLNPVTQARC